jgi:cellulose biosynthesis protein BcsQ
MAEASDGRIVTFYSYKGGTGRSMALANFAWILAAGGKSVLAIDWDLEAPGLHRYFRPFLSDPELVETDGLVDAFWSLAATALESTQQLSGPSADEGERIADALEDATRRLQPVRAPGLADGAPGLFPSGGHIDFIGAGRQGTDYSARVNTFAWQRFYDLDGARLIEVAKSHLRRNYDWILIDSRTGVSDTAGICTIQMPDTVVACFTPNRQSITGVAGVLRSIRSYESSTVKGSDIQIFPLATRIENLEPRKLETSRGYYRETLREFLPHRFQPSPRTYWDLMEIPYKTGYAFEELLAAFGDATGSLGAADTMLTYVEKMAQCIADDPTLSIPEIVETDRTLVLARYALGDEPAERGLPDRKTRIVFSDEFVEDSDSDILRNVRAKEQVWRTSGFFWRRLMSQRELDLLTEADRAGFGRNMSFYLTQSRRMQDFLGTADWMFVISLVLGLAAGGLFYYFRTAAVTAAPVSGPTGLYLLFAAGTGLLVFWTMAIIWAMVLSRSSRKPYGLGFPSIALLVSFGPARLEIRDYAPSAKPRAPS